MKNYLYIFIITIFITGCSSLSLSTDYDDKIDFSSFKTYRWYEEKDDDNNKTSLKFTNSIMDQRIRETIDQQLQLKNYSKTNTGAVDFLVNYSVVVEDQVDVRTYNNYSGMYPGYGYYGRGMSVGYGGSPETVVTYYKQGTLIIDIINPETDQLMWRGAADGRLPKSANREESDVLVQKYVTKILSAFPPKN